MDANEAVAYVAYRVNEVIAIYPITPSSNMGEWSDQWAAEVAAAISMAPSPTVIEMQSEGGASASLYTARCRPARWAPPSLRRRACF